MGRKRHKQIINFNDVTVGKVPLSEKVQCLRMSYIRNNIVVCDGSDTDTDGIKNHLLITIFLIFKFVRVIYGYQIRLTHQLVFVILWVEINHLCLFVFLERRHLVL